ncbi:MAG TPA: FimV/HubP family polar landmark protein [Limnobacter sp.]|nr:FimV/HubP family polar landmark protein [Limnobacter sp.]
MFASSLAQAAQLGKLEVLSRAGEPFQAQIQVDAVQPAERASLKAALAPPEAFQAARLVVDPNLRSLQFAVEDGPRPGTALVKITSTKALPQGFLDALVELSWAGGRVAREYTFTIPADAAASKAETTQLPAISPPRTLPPVNPQAATAPATTSSQAAAPATTAPAPVTQTAAASAAQLLVKRGDTLSELALQLVGDGVSLNQAMAAIYEENRDAFINGSVHLIREGAQIRVPNRAAVRARSANEALLVLARNDDRNVYSAYARQIGLLTVANATESKVANTSQGNIAPKQAPAAAANKAEDRLQIAPSVQHGGGASDAAAEELVAKNKALAEANERIALLEKNVSDLQKLLEMQQGEEASASTTLPAKATATDPLANPVAADDTPPAADDPALSVPAQSPLPEEATAPVDATVEQADNTSAQAPVGEDGNLVPWLLAGAGGLIGLVVLLLIARSRKKTSETPGVSESDDSTFSEVQDFDNALAAMAAEQADQKVDSGLKAVSDDSFDLEDVLTESTRPEASTSEKPRVETPEAASQASVDEEPIPELNVESEQASEQRDSLDSPVTLEFPEDTAKPEQPSSIFDDLDSLEKGAVAAQEELDELRKQPLPAREADSEEVASAFDDLVDADQSNPVAQPGEAPEQSAAVEVPQEAFDQAIVDLDVDVPNPKIDEATWQEVATKLDLAGAYVEIGDADGAKELLNEIIKKGDVDQVRKAKALLGTLG